MNQRPTEYCCVCGEPTGKACRADDSLYCDICDTGPFCKDCYDAHADDCRDARIAELEAELATAKIEMERLRHYEDLANYCFAGFVRCTLPENVPDNDLVVLPLYVPSGAIRAVKRQWAAAEKAREA